MNRFFRSAGAIVIGNRSSNRLSPASVAEYTGSKRACAS
jgi:hypothetical protein